MTHTSRQNKQAQGPESAPSFYCVGSGGGTWALRLGSKHFYLLAFSLAQEQSIMNDINASLVRK